MATPIVMPKVGITVETCVLTKWHKQKGAPVKKGDALFTYETDKSTVDEEAPLDGVLLDTFYPEGADLPCLTNVCAIGKAGESADAFKPQSSAQSTVHSAQSAEQITNYSPQSTVHSAQLKDNVGRDAPAAPPVNNNMSLRGAQSATSQSQPINQVSGNSYQVSGIGQDNKQTDNNSQFSILNSQFPKISPRARVLAAKTGADINRAVPTGAEGRIVERDIAAVAAAYTPAAMNAAASEGTGMGGRVRAADEQASGIRYQVSGIGQESLRGAQSATSQSQPINSPLGRGGRGADGVVNVPEYIDEKLSSVRKVIAKTMHESLSNMAQLTLNASFDATQILAFRASIKANAAKMKLPNITLNDIVMYAVARTLPAHKALNALFMGDFIRSYNAVHLGMAVDTDRGLLVPTIANAERLGLAELSAEAKSLAEAAMKGSIPPAKLSGATFTISNLGVFGIESFTPVINPPQVAILGVCGITEKVKTENGVLKTYQSMGLSLTIDHRAVDGAPAAKFLKELCENLSNFALMLL